MATPHWLFRDQLGPHFLTPDREQGPDRAAPVVMIEARSVFSRRRFHRAKAHLVLSAMRPVRSLPGVRVLPARRFLVAHEEFARWAEGRGGRRLLPENFYRWVRERHDLLMDGGRPAGAGSTTTTTTASPLRGAPPHWTCRGRTGRARTTSTPRCGRTSRGGSARTQCGSSAGTAPAAFPPPGARPCRRCAVSWRTGCLPSGRTRTRCRAGDPVMAHSLLSSSMNLGLLHPAECVERAERAWREGAVPVNSAEGFPGRPMA
jgi:deoxyribodipyrimidine photolyase-related protein